MGTFSLFDTWLGFFGLVVGFFLAAAFDWRPLRSAIGGYVCGVVLVICVNMVSPTPPACLQNSKGADILRAYILC